MGPKSSVGCDQFSLLRDALGNENVLKGDWEQLEAVPIYFALHDLAQGVSEFQPSPECALVTVHLY